MILEQQQTEYSLFSPVNYEDTNWVQSIMSLPTLKYPLGNASIISGLSQPHSRASIRSFVAQHPPRSTNIFPSHVKQSLLSMDCLFDANFTSWVTSEDPMTMNTMGRYLRHYSKDYSIEQLSAVVLFIIEKWSQSSIVHLLCLLSTEWLKPLENKKDINVSSSDNSDNGLATCCRFLNLVLVHYWHQPALIADVAARLLQIIEKSTQIPCSARNGCHCQSRSKSSLHHCPFASSYYRMKASCTESVLGKKYLFLLRLIKRWKLENVSTFLSYLGPLASLDNNFRVQILQAVMKGSLETSPLRKRKQSQNPSSPSKSSKCEEATISTKAEKSIITIAIEANPSAITTASSAELSESNSSPSSPSILSARCRRGSHRRTRSKNGVCWELDNNSDTPQSTFEITRHSNPMSSGECSSSPGPPEISTSMKEEVTSAATSNKESVRKRIYEGTNEESSHSKRTRTNSYIPVTPE